MKAVLDNPRHELYAQELAKGASQTEGYVTAGYKPDAAAACRLSRKVKFRVAELQNKAAERTITTIHDIAAQLDVDRKFARKHEAPAAAISATMGKAKVLGLLVEKTETKVELAEVMSDIELARLIVFQLTKASKALALESIGQIDQCSRETVDGLRRG